MKVKCNLADELCKNDNTSMFCRHSVEHEKDEMCHKKCVVHRKAKCVEVGEK